MKKYYLLALFIIIIGIAFYTLRVSNVPPKNTLLASTPTSKQVLGVQTKFSNCVVHGALPDSDCTPGAIITSATKEQICVAGYSKSVRNVPKSEKDHVFEEYGVVMRSPGEYEVDHLISLELGGSNSIANLWPEAADPRPGFHEKDRFENYLHENVCSGKISLQEAQYEIAHDWLLYWSKVASL